MLKIITLAVVFLTVVLLHGANGGPVRRQTADDSTRRPKLIRVHLNRTVPNRNVVWDVDADGRSKREASEELEFFGGHRSPLMKPIKPNGPKRTDAEAVEDFFRSEPKGFEARELEERLAEAEVVDEAADATDGRALTDDENQRFDVETTTPKMSRLEFFDWRHECDRNF